MPPNASPHHQPLKGPAEIDVLLAESLPRTFSYLLEEGQEALRGQIVRAPFGKQQAYGVVLGSGQSGLPREKLKPVEILADLPSLNPILLSFVDWVADYCMAPAGAVLAMSLGGSKILEPIKRAKKETPLAAGHAAAPELSPAQADIATRFQEQVKEARFAVTLLDGVTGSGKTEVFCEAIATCFAEGKQALLLLPEIALTSQILDRLRARFGFEPALWHSQLSMGARKRIWRDVAAGKTPLVIGARSALFLPFARLGVLVVDEEHDGSYKQDEGVTYHARDMAVVRGKLENIPVILSSATPALETMVNVKAGRYGHAHLPERHGDAGLPTLHLIDLRQEKLARQCWLSPTLQQAVREALARGEQTLLFLNRRGYAPLTLCRACGQRLGCPQCSSWLVEHRQDGKHRLTCHHCDYACAYPTSCPLCKAEGKLAACGPGVERLAEEAARLFPNARRSVLASDSHTSLQALHETIADMQAGKIDILIGTQITAKGYHFPALTVVGVIDGDLGLQGGDMRAAERTFQLLHQVAGRSGRAAQEGHVYIQTVQPQHAVMQCLLAHDRDRLMDILIHEREKYAMPPFARLATLTLSGTRLDAVEQAGAALARLIPQYPGVQVFGPSPAPFALLRGRHRQRFLVRAGKQVKIQDFISGWLAKAKISRTLRLHIDIDPQSFV